MTSKRLLRPAVLRPARGSGMAGRPTRRWTRTNRIPNHGDLVEVRRDLI
jgi:hypothetical protein